MCVSAVWCCFGVCLLPSLESSDQLAVTYNVLGATRTLPELLGWLSRSMQLCVRGLNADKPQPTLIPSYPTT